MNTNLPENFQTIPDEILTELHQRFTTVVDELNIGTDENSKTWLTNYTTPVEQEGVVKVLDPNTMERTEKNGATVMGYLVRGNEDPDGNTFRVRAILESGIKLNPNNP